MLVSFLQYRTPDRSYRLAHLTEWKWTASSLYVYINTLTRVHFQYFKYTEFYFFYDSFDIVWNHVSSAALLLVVQQHLSRPRFPWITPSLILPLKKKKLFLHLHHLFLRFNHKLPQLLSTLWWPTIVYERSAEFRSLYQPVMSANQHAYFQHWSAWIHFY